MGRGEIPFAGRVPKPVEERIVRVDPLFDRNGYHIDSRLKLHDLLNHPFICHSVVGFPLVRSLNPNFYDLVKELARESFKGTVLLNTLEPKDGSKVPQQVIRCPLGLEEHMGDVGCTNKNFMECGFRMIRKARETESLQGRKVNGWRGDC